ncbi:Alpha/beta hydrolase fold-1 [Xylogone sp. PMI_703]|nr:Alpha/beta hydrolase fold-1 [Xylogone sp. PMI_703]
MASQKPVIVIVPGAFHKPIHYRKVVEPLRSQGYEVITPSLVVCGDDSVSPDATHLDDAANIHKHLLPALDEGKRAIIVSHSYGSLPATASVEGQTVAERAARNLKGGIVGVISIAGFAFPVRGKSIMGDDEIPPPMPYHVVEDGIAHLQETAKPIFFSGLSPEEADAEWGNLSKKISRKCFTTFPQYIESDIPCAKTYVLCENDQAVPPAFQEAMAKTGGFDIARVPSGHAPFLSIPEEIVKIIIGVAEKQ